MENGKGINGKYGNIKKFWTNLSYGKLVGIMYQPRDPSSLGIIRILFGLLMMMDLPEERGGSDIDLRWGEPNDCHFPLFPFIQPLPYPYMAVMYGIMWIGALGMTIGYKFNYSTLLFGLPYWYLLLLDKSFWNNHSYLFGIITILLAGSSANHFLSVDSYFDQRKRNTHVPYWNYFILKFQFFLLYFMAGLKKTDMEWLEGYSMSSLGTHWVFKPFTLILTADQIDYLIVHWCGFLLDLTVGFWMIVETTRPIAMVFCACFHLMNSRLFSIGMFPYVCLATMPLFCTENWPKKLTSCFGYLDDHVKPSSDCLYTQEEINKIHCGNKELESKITWKHRMVVGLLACHCGLQIFLPYSHFITLGYNNWTNGLYGYSWDMMVHSWDTTLVTVKIVDNNSGTEYFIDPEIWTQNDRWTKHADMCLQYAQCLKRNLHQDFESVTKSSSIAQRKPSKNISIFIDVWCSLNGRFQQRMYDPNYDLLQAKWSPFEPTEWLKPLLREYNYLRSDMSRIIEEVYSWSNFSDVLFVADFPGLYLENYINDDLKNVSVTVLEGEIFYEIENDELNQSFGVKLRKGESSPVEIGIFHKIHTLSVTPSCYMYTFVNETIRTLQEGKDNRKWKKTIYSPFPLVEDIGLQIDGVLRMIGHISNSFLHILYGTPLVRRKKLQVFS